MRSSDWSSDVCSSDLRRGTERYRRRGDRRRAGHRENLSDHPPPVRVGLWFAGTCKPVAPNGLQIEIWSRGKSRSEEHTSELQSLMRISYAVFCLKKKKQTM